MQSTIVSRNYHFGSVSNTTLFVHKTVSPRRYHCLGLILLAASGLLCYGCEPSIRRMYAGPSLPRGQVAVVKTSYPITLRSVDATHLGGNAPSGVELLPGHHAFTVVWLHIWPEYPLDGTGRQLTHILKVAHTLDVEFDALQGKEYALYGPMNENHTEAFVIVTDTSTSELVAQSEKAALCHEILQSRF
jgi:hypothetical protein